jgi:hypothetical protein
MEDMGLQLAVIEGNVHAPAVNAEVNASEEDCEGSDVDIAVYLYSWGSMHAGFTTAYAEFFEFISHDVQPQPHRSKCTQAHKNVQGFMSVLRTPCLRRLEVCRIRTSAFQQKCIRNYNMRRKIHQHCNCNT